MPVQLEQPTEDPQAFCDDSKHEYYDDYYGVRCRKCPWFAAYGCEPWAPDYPDESDEFYDDCDLDECGEEMYDCHGHFDSQRADAHFMCGAVGSEDCDECPMHSWLGLTNRQIDSLEGVE